MGKKEEEEKIFFSGFKATLTFYFIFLLFCVNPQCIGKKLPALSFSHCSLTHFYSHSQLAIKTIIYNVNENVFKLLSRQHFYLFIYINRQTAKKSWKLKVYFLRMRKKLGMLNFSLALFHSFYSLCHCFCFFFSYVWMSKHIFCHSFSYIRNINTGKYNFQNVIENKILYISY